MNASSNTAMAAFLRKLLTHSTLSEEEQQAILGLKSRTVEVPGRRDLVAPGEIVDHAVLVAQGVLGRFDLMRNGARQITAVFIPGDMCDLHSVVAPKTGWGIVALTPSTVLHIPHDELRQRAADYPNVAFAFWRDTTLDASVLAKWIAVIGRKSARERVAHFLCELAVRMERVGQGDRNGYRFELTQEQVGDALGLTSVHVNRVLRSLREADLASVKDRAVEILRWDGLVKLADFSPTYLLLHEKQVRGC